jgi:hypothetical protein
MKKPTQLKTAEFSTLVYHHYAQAGETLEDVTAPSYWQHVASQLKPGHEIKVGAIDHSFYAHLCVKSVGKQEANVAVLLHSDLTKTDGEIPSEELDVFVKFINPAPRYGVFRKSDNEKLEHGFHEKEDAWKWAGERQKELVA